MALLRQDQSPIGEVIVSDAKDLSERCKYLMWALLSVKSGD
jgi:hypothetical protein